jgi:hypothetical protein
MVLVEYGVSSHIRLEPKYKAIEVSCGIQNLLKNFLIACLIIDRIEQVAQQSQSPAGIMNHHNLEIRMRLQCVLSDLEPWPATKLCNRSGSQQKLPSIKKAI